MFGWKDLSSFTIKDDGLSKITHVWFKKFARIDKR